MVVACWPPGPILTGKIIIAHFLLPFISSSPAGHLPAIHRGEGRREHDRAFDWEAQESGVHSLQPDISNSDCKSASIPMDAYILSFIVIASRGPYAQCILQ